MEKILPAIINIDGKPVVSVALTQISNCYDNIFTSTLNTCQTNIVLCGGGHGAGYHYRSFHDNLSADIEKNRFVCPNELLQKLQLILQAVDSNNRDNRDNCLRERIPDLIRKASMKNNVLSMNFSGYGDYDDVGVDRERNNQLIHKFAGSSTNFRNGNLDVLMPNSNQGISQLRTISRNLFVLFSNNNLPNGIDRESLNSINHNLINPTDFLIINYMQSLFTAVMLTYISADQNIRYRIFGNINKLVADSLNNEESLMRIREQNLFDILIGRIFNGVGFLQTPDYKRIEELAGCICNNVLMQADHVTQIDFIVLDKTERTISDGFIDNEGHFFVPYSSILKNSKLTEKMQQILNGLAKLEQEATSKKIDISLENISNDFTGENLIQACQAILVPGEVMTCPDFSNPQFIETLVRQNKIYFLPKEQLQAINFKISLYEGTILEIIKSSQNNLSKYQIITIFEKQSVKLIIAIISHSKYINYLPKSFINDFSFDTFMGFEKKELINACLNASILFPCLTADIVDNIDIKRLDERTTNNLIAKYWDKLSDEQFTKLDFDNVYVGNLIGKNLSETRVNLIKANWKPILENLMPTIPGKGYKREIRQQNLKDIEWLFSNNYIIDKAIYFFRQVYYKGELVKFFTQEELTMPKIEDIQYMLKSQFEQANINNLDFSNFNPGICPLQDIIKKLTNKQIQQLNLSNINILKSIIAINDESAKRKLIDVLSNAQINQVDKNNDEVLIIILSCDDDNLVKKLLDISSTEEMIQQFKIHILKIINNYDDTEKIKTLINKLSQEKFQQIDLSQVTNTEKFKVIIKERKNDLSKEQILRILNNTNIDLLSYLIDDLRWPVSSIINFDDECYQNLKLNNLSYGEFDWLVISHADKLSDEQIHQIDTSTIFIKAAVKKRSIVSKFTKEQIQRIDFNQILAIPDINNENNWMQGYHGDRWLVHSDHVVSWIPINPEQISNMPYQDFCRYWDSYSLSGIFDMAYYSKDLSREQVLYLMRLYEVMKRYLNQNPPTGEQTRLNVEYNHKLKVNKFLFHSLLSGSYSKYFPLDLIQSIDIQNLLDEFLRSIEPCYAFIFFVKTSYDEFSEEQKEQINLSTIFNYYRERWGFYLVFKRICFLMCYWQNSSFVSLKEKIKTFKFSYSELGFANELLKRNFYRSSDAFYIFEFRYINNPTILLTSLKNFFCDFKGNGFFKSLYNGEKNDELYIPPNILKQIVCLKARDCYGFEKGMKIVRKLRSYFSKLPQEYKNELNQINEIDLMNEETMMKKGSGFIKQICQGNANYLMQGRKYELFGNEYYLNREFLECGEKNELIKGNLLEILNQKILSYSLEKQTKILQHFKDNVQNIHPEILSYLSTKFNVEFPQNEITHDAQNINLIH